MALSWQELDALQTRIKNTERAVFLCQLRVDAAKNLNPPDPELVALRERTLAGQIQELADLKQELATNTVESTAPGPQEAQAQAVQTNQGSTNYLAQGGADGDRGVEPAPSASNNLSSTPANSSTAAPTIGTPTTTGASQAGINPPNTVTDNASSTQSSTSKPDKRWQNPLGNFSSYTYQISLYMITPDAYDAFIQSGRTNLNAINNVQAGAVSAETATAQQDARIAAFDASRASSRGAGGGESPPSPSSANAPTTSYTNGAYLIAQSGGTNNTTSQRAPGFDLDFYIDNLRIKQAIQAKDTQATTNTSEISFTITEPYGFSFVTRLRNAATELAKVSKSKNFSDLQNPSRQFFILGIRFLGYDKNGNVIDPTKVPGTDGDPKGNAFGLYERFYDISITGMKFTIEGKAVTYNITAASLPTRAAFGTKRGIVDQGASILASTVYEALLGSNGVANTKPGESAMAQNASGNNVNKIGLLAKLNNDQIVLQRNGAIEIANQWDVKFIGEAENTIRNASIISKADLDKRKWAMSSSTKKSESTTKSELASTPDSSAKQITFNNGTPILQCINQIILQSSFLENALKTVYVSGLEPDPDKNSNAEAPTGADKTIKWYTISPEVTVLGWDTKQKDFVYKTTFIIQQYETPIITSSYANTGIKYYGPHKRYEYWFTGKNSEILSYVQTMDNTYFTVSMSADKSGTSATGGGADIPNTAGKPQGQPDQGALTVGLEAQNSYMTSLFDPGAYAEAKIKILGDPDFLMQPSTSSINELYNRFYGTDGFTINPNGGQVFIEINFKEPQDYKDGLLSINSSIYFWAYPTDIQKDIDSRGGGVSYMVTTVTSNFSGGKFEQDLDCVINTFPSGKPKTDGKDDTAGRPADGSDNRFARQGTPTNQTAATQNRTGVNLTNTSAGGGRGVINNEGPPTTANGSASTSSTGFASSPTSTFLDPQQRASLANDYKINLLNNLAAKPIENQTTTIPTKTGPVVDGDAGYDYMGR
jgi:hypothetical protein